MPWHPALASIALTLGLAALPACQGQSAAMVDRARVTLEFPAQGFLRVHGLPGAVLGGPISTVTLSVWRDAPASPAPNRYQLLHFGAGLAVSSTFAVVDAGGGFDSVLLGAEDRPVLPGDELTFTLYRGLAQQGYVLTMPVSWRP